ncbi:MAG: heme exporter protein CcmD [Amylibacter sp.]
MIPNLGKYATDVLSAYAITILLLVALITVSLRQSAKARKALKDAEQRAEP